MVVGNIDKKVRFGLVFSNHNCVVTGIGQCHIEKNTVHILFSYLFIMPLQIVFQCTSFLNVVSHYTIVHVAIVFRGIRALGTLLRHQFLGGVCSQAASTRIIIMFLFDSSPYYLVPHNSLSHPPLLKAFSLVY